ncbi:hypothetical protein, partial [Psychrobacter sp. UBA6766]|uniref:hypothetical protein n=1 Tax=Psychrobacter sp. UBA6766 TaxID=1947361 RepID=UPI0025FDCFFB
MTVSPSEEPVEISESATNIDNTSKTVAESVVETKSEPPPTEDILLVESNSPAEDNNIDNPFGDTNSTPIALMEKPKPEPEPEP